MIKNRINIIADVYINCKVPIQKVHIKKNIYKMVRDSLLIKGKCCLRYPYDLKIVGIKFHK